MAQKVSTEGLADAIVESLKEYSDVVTEDFKEVAKKVAKEGTQRLKKTSPKGDGSKKGHYANGWTVTAVESGTNKFSFVVNNRKKPGLTHLLEKGHQLWQGGRAKAIPHIKPVEDWCNREFEKRVEAMLRK